MAQDYDKILKENIGELFLVLSKKYLRVEIKHSEELKDKLQTTLEKEADFLRKVETPQGEQLIVHLEFQTSDEKHMVYRMQEYFAILQKKYQLPIRQFVIYVGEKPPQMRTELSEYEVFTGFELMNLKEIHYTQLLDSHIPEEVILAILGDFNNQTSEKVLRQIIVKLQKLSSAPITLNKYLRQLFVFARLRNLTEVTQKQLNTMAFTYDIEKDAFFKRGKEKGREEGRLEGMQEGKLEGIQEGLQKGKESTAINLLKLGKFTYKEIAQITDLTLEQIEAIAKKQ
ncbi:MAG TPA: hypothetical protein DCS93_24865 [Microscillaceae bacterium]|nr:hypothetical protein [Microscillaceae bacterium]